MPVEMIIGLPLLAVYFIDGISAISKEAILHCGTFSYPKKFTAEHRPLGTVYTMTCRP